MSDDDLRAHGEGVWAFLRDVPYGASPYPFDADDCLHHWWCNGWLRAQLIHSRSPLDLKEWMTVNMKQEVHGNQFT
jgi:hypothetical protein